MMITRRQLFCILGALPLAGRFLTTRRRPTRQLDVLDTTVAGYRFHCGPPIEHLLHAGENVGLRREAANPHDAGAIVIHHRSGLKIGYVPRRVNSVPARLMDQGAGLRTTLAVIQLAPAPPWERLMVRITMDA